MIDLRQFHQFIAVAEELNFRAAAKRLNMAQPPLTAVIKRMEVELGGCLIERKSNRVVGLTEPGVLFLQEARRAVAQAEYAIEAAKRATKGLSGVLRLNFVPSTAHGLLPRLLRAMRAQYPDISLILEEANSADQVRALRQDRIDAGIVVSPLHDAEGFTLELLQRERLAIALPQEHRLAKTASVDLADLASDDWIGVPAKQGPGLYSSIVAACAKAGFIPRITQEAPHMNTIVGLVAGNLGISLVPASLATLGRQGVCFKEPRGKGTPINYDLILAYRRSTPVVSAFAKLSRSLLQSKP
jgi:DNA-binding transcriptional LysR family regulator